MALACGGQFDKYLDVTMIMLVQASATKVDDNNDELVEFLNELREGVLDAYTGILNGLEDGGKQVMLLQPTNFVEKIMQFLEKVAADENTDETVYKVLARACVSASPTLGSTGEPSMVENSPFRIRLVSSWGDCGSFDSGHLKYFEVARLITAEYTME